MELGKSAIQNLVQEKIRPEGALMLAVLQFSEESSQMSP